MDKSSNPTVSKGLIAGVVAIALLGFGYYSFTQHKKESGANSDVKKEATQETKQEVKKDNASSQAPASGDVKPAAAKGRFSAEDRQEI